MCSILVLNESGCAWWAVDPSQSPGGKSRGQDRGVRFDPAPSRERWRDDEDDSVRRTDFGQNIDPCCEPGREPPTGCPSDRVSCRDVGSGAHRDRGSVRVGHAPRVAERMMMGSSFIGDMVSGVMSLGRWTARSSVFSMRVAPMKRVMACSFGRIPTTKVRHLIAPLRCSIGFVECS